MRTAFSVPRIRFLAGSLAASAFAITMVVLPAAYASAGTSPGQAGNATGLAATSATTFQTSTVAAALRNNPTGVQIAPNEVSWDNGKVIMVVPSTPDASVIPAGSASLCPSGFLTGQWSCVFNAPNFNGTMLQFQDCCYAQDLQHYGGDYWATWSWSNTRSQRAWIRPDQFDGNGPELCMTGNAAAGSVLSQYRNDRWIYLTTNTAHC